MNRTIYCKLAHSLHQKAFYLSALLASSLRAILRPDSRSTLTCSPGGTPCHSWTSCHSPVGRNSGARSCSIFSQCSTLSSNSSWPRSSSRLCSSSRSSPSPLHTLLELDLAPQLLSPLQQQPL